MRLYKYYSFTDYNLSALEARSFWIANIADFNDPFEFRILRPEDCSQVEGLHTMRMQNLHLAHLSDEQFCDKYLSQFQDHFAEWGTTCFSEDPLNLLMWAHYAKCHTGYCLQFETSEDDKQFLFPVTYRENYPKISLVSLMDRTGMAQVIFTKSIHWQYEKEWRKILVSSRHLEPYRIKLTGVIFGAKASEDDKKRISNILEDQVEYYQASLHPTNYGLLTTPKIG